MKGYTRTYITGRVATQIMLDKSDGFLVRLIPTVDVTLQNYCAHVGVGIYWMFGAFTIAFMRKHWLRQQEQREKHRRDHADKLGITYHELMEGCYYDGTK